MAASECCNRAAGVVLRVRTIDRQGPDTQPSAIEYRDGAVVEILLDRWQVGRQQHCLLLRCEWLDGSQQHERRVG